MTTYNHHRTRNRDQQDLVKRHVWGSVEYTDAGAILTVSGTGTTDEEVPVLNTGYAFNVPKDYNTEVMLISFGSDTTLKYAIPSIPRDKQRPWKENAGGVQNPIDPAKALEFNPKRAHVKEKNFALGDNGEVELLDGVLYIRVPVVIDASIQIKGNLDVSGDVQVGGSAVIGGSLDAQHIESRSGGDSPSSPSISINVPAFEDYDG